MFAAAAAMVTPGWLVKNAMTVMMWFDDCANDCVVQTCGDGRLLEGVEACDDGNRIDHDACGELWWRFAAMASLEMISRWEAGFEE